MIELRERDEKNLQSRAFNFVFYLLSFSFFNFNEVSSF